MDLNIRGLEKILLTGKWTGSVQPSLWLHELTKNTVEGAFYDVLTSPQSRDFFTVRQSVSDQPLDEWFQFNSPSQATEEQEFLRLLLAVTCLQAFLQANWTGPDLNIKALDILTVPSDLTSHVTEELIQHKSLAELAYGGEPAYHLAQLPVLLRLAKILLDLPYAHCHTAAWWRLRAWLVHEHVLDEPTAVPEDLLVGLRSVNGDIASGSDLEGRVLLEQGLLDHTLAQDRDAAELFVRAARATKLEYELTGAMGKRTKFQEREITQLVLLAESYTQDENTAVEDADKTAVAKSAMPETFRLNDDTLLEQTQFTSSFPATPGSRLAHLDPSNQSPLDPLDQCILLAMCLNVKNTSPAHGLTAEQMAPYVDRVITHARNWSVHTMALLLRSRLEANRTRTIDRSTLQLQALVDQMPTADSTVQERLLYIHDLSMPSKWELQRELASRFLSLGVVKSALEIFERLEMWEEVVRCWQGLEQPEKGVAVVRDLLEGRKAESDVVVAREKTKDATAARKQRLDAGREGKLWCLLGDLEPAQAAEHYTKAWEVSGHTSGRAMRSLGGYHFARGAFGDAIVCLRRAVAINPLLSRSWFILGCAYVRMEQWDGAREAFTRCVAIDEEDGESWNNLASVYLRMGEAGKRIEPAQEDDDELASQAEKLVVSASASADARIPFTNRLLAFRALKQGLRFGYDNWRMWSNYMVVALDVGELSEAARALGRVVEERSAKDGADAVDEDVLERLVSAATRAQPDAPASDGSAPPTRHPNEGLLRQVADLLERVILPRVSSPRIFRARARLLTAQGRLAEALKAYLDAYQASGAGRGADETDTAAWRAGVREVEDLVDVLRNFGPRVEGYRWRLQARSVLRTFMGRMKDFEDEPEWEKLVEMQEELKQEEQE